ncbi:MAG: hypothetical protein ISS15_10195 [Alphaproteobacteria bacterium]|nr:hypothetical protein [Alphaproteobacteria bacterium]MBL6938623.1 hypothetical protein [Alphaproteobacteria bacterium]MBL7098020.1 hypothetical protein [Alphaproteobacteria bacterium]
MKMVLASVFAVGLMAAVAPTAAGAANAGIGFTGVTATTQQDANIQAARWYRHHHMRYCTRWGWHHHRRWCSGWGWR